MLSFQSYRNIIKTKIAEGSARSLTLVTPQGLSGQNTSAISIDNIAETLKMSTMKKTQKPTTNAHGMDFNEFSLEKVLTGAGDMIHGRFTLLKKKTARMYKNTPKVRGYRHICTK